MALVQSVALNVTTLNLLSAPASGAGGATIRAAGHRAEGPMGIEAAPAPDNAPCSAGPPTYLPVLLRDCSVLVFSGGE